MSMLGRLWTVLFFILSFTISFCSSLVDQVYVQLAPERTVCFRLLNGTHQFGCQSSRNGQVGVVVRVQSRSDLDGLNKDCWTERFPDYSKRQFAIVIDMHLLDRSSIETLRSSPCVFLVLLVNSQRKDTISQVDTPGSDDQTCPNQHSSLYEECSGWNEKGAKLPEGLTFTDWQKPIIYVTNQTNLKKIEKCHSTFNVPPKGASSVHFPLCAISVKAFSYAAGSSELCLRRSHGATIELDNPVSFCDALQDYNVFSVIPPKASHKRRNEKEEIKAKYLAIVTRMDSLSFIPEVSPGELSSITSLIASLAAAKAISQHRSAFEQSAEKNGKRLLFSYFHGEAFDYIGSSRTVFDMSSNKFPAAYDESKTEQKELISMNEIDSYVEIQQIGSPTSGFFAHVHKPSYEKRREETDALINATRKGLLSSSVSLSLSSSPTLPPSSLFSFIRGNRSMAAIVVTPFDTKYEYSRVNSMLDTNNYSHSERVKMEEAIEATSRALVQVAKDFCSVEESISVDRKFITILFDCLITSSDWWNCSFLDALLEESKNIKAHKMEKTTYIGADSQSLIRYVTAAVLVHSTGSKAETQNVHEKEQCEEMNKQQTLFSYVWQRDPFSNASYCLRTTVFYGRAISPAFLDRQTDLMTTSYSTWTETAYSISWDNKRSTVSGPRLFLLDGSSSEKWMFGAGCVFALFSLLIIGRLKEEIFVFDEGEPMAEQGEPL